MLHEEIRIARERLRALWADEQTDDKLLFSALEQIRRLELAQATLERAGTEAPELELPQGLDMEDAR